MFPSPKRRGTAAAAIALFGVFALSSVHIPNAQAAAADVPRELRGEISTLSSDVKKKKAQLSDLQKKADQYRDLIAQKKLESATIADQIALIDNRVAKTQLHIEIAETEIKEFELEIAALAAKIKDQEGHIGRQKNLISAMVRKLQYLRANRSTFEVLLSHASFSEFFDELHAVARLQGSVKKALDHVRQATLAMEADQAGRENKQSEVADRKRSLEAARIDLEDERATKSLLLDTTKTSELEYRYLLGDLKREQNDADSEIVYLEKALRAKLDLADRLGSANAVFSWPVSPARGISARFHDPDYPFRNVFEHPAIDIRAAQGTAVRAAAAGIIARAKDAGLGYSYVMIIHNGGLSTVYGHLSRISAKEDTFVERGEIIGYSGGMPGTHGAGGLTTGPHLHFETRRGGIPVDPLSYLVAP